MLMFLSNLFSANDVYVKHDAIVICSCEARTDLKSSKIIRNGILSVIVQLTIHLGHWEPGKLSMFGNIFKKCVRGRAF